MNIYKMSNEDLAKIASEFNNTNYGRKIWLYSKLPEVIGFLTLIIYILLTCMGASYPEIKDVVTYYIVVDLIMIGISMLAIGFAEVLYWKHVSKYVASLVVVEEKKLSAEKPKRVKKVSKSAATKNSRKTKKTEK